MSNRIDGVIAKPAPSVVSICPDGVCDFKLQVRRPIPGYSNIDEALMGFVCELRSVIMKYQGNYEAYVKETPATEFVKIKVTNEEVIGAYARYGVFFE